MTLTPIVQNSYKSFVDLTLLQIPEDESSIDVAGNMGTNPTNATLHGGFESVMLQKVKGQDGQIKVHYQGSVATGLSKLRQESRFNQAWFDDLDLLDADVCCRADMLQLLVDAPTTYLSGYIFGKLSLRMSMGTMDMSSDPEMESLGMQKIQSLQNDFQEVCMDNQTLAIALENTDPDYCSLEELAGLMSLSSSELVQGMLFGKMSMLMHRAFVQGV